MTNVTSNQTSSLAYAALAEQENEERVYLGVPLSGWLKVATLAVLFILLFWPNLRRLWDKTNPFTGEDNWRHAPFVPLIGLYYLYVNREQLAKARKTTTWVGLPIMLFGILLFGYAIWPLQNDWFKDVGMVITLFGVVTLMCGWQVMKTAWFPIVFLICALPWPGLFYSKLAGPLQEMAARVAVRVMGMIGVQSGQAGTKIFVEGKDHFVHTLNVAEACAGLRSLMTFIAIAAAVAFLSFRPLWQKLIMVFSAIPIAIFCNTMRVTVQGVMARYLSMQWAEGAAHGLVGLVMMIPAFFLILLVGWVLQNIFIDEVDDKRALREGATTSQRPKRRPAEGQLAGRGAVVARAADAGSKIAPQSPRPAVQTAAAPRMAAPKAPAPATARAVGATPATPSTAAPARPASAGAPAAATRPAAGAGGIATPAPARPAPAATAVPGVSAAPGAPRKPATAAAGANAGVAPRKPAAPAGTAPAASSTPTAPAVSRSGGGSSSAQTRAPASGGSPAGAPKSTAAPAGPTAAPRSRPTVAPAAQKPAGPTEEPKA